MADTQQLLPSAALDPLQLPLVDVLASRDGSHEAKVHMPWVPLTADSDLMICMLPQADYLHCQSNLMPSAKDLDSWTAEETCQLTMGVSTSHH